MALLGDAIYSILTDDATVGGLVSTRVTPVLREEKGALPAVTYQRVGGEQTHRHDGPSSHAKSRVQVDSWAETVTGAQDLADAVRQALDDKSGTFGSYAIQGVQTAAPPVEFFETDVRVPRVSQDFIISHMEGTP